MICRALAFADEFYCGVSCYRYAPVWRRGISGRPFLGELFLPQGPVPSCASEQNGCRNVLSTADTRLKEDATW